MPLATVVLPVHCITDFPVRGLKPVYYTEFYVRQITINCITNFPVRGLKTHHFRCKKAMDLWL